jgi:uncharacterized protein YkwD
MKTLLAIVLPILLIVMIAGMIRLHTLENEINNQNVFNAVNEWRVNHGLQPIINNEYMCKIAKIRFAEASNDWSHNGFNAGRWCSDCVLGETLARGFIYYPEVIGAWEKSPTHKAELEGNYQYGCVETDGQYVVLNLGSW